MGKTAPAAWADDSEDEVGQDARAAALRRIQELLDAEDGPGLRAAVEDLHDADLADVIEALSAPRRVALTARIDLADRAEMFVHLRPEVRREIMARLPPPALAGIVDELESDDALEVLVYLDDDARAEVVRLLSSRLRLVVEQSLTWPEDSAGRLCQRAVIAFPQFWTVGKTIDYLREAAETLPDEFYDLFIVDPMHRVVGTIHLSRMIRARRGVKLEALKDEEVHTIPASMDQEEVADRFRRYSLASAPVVDDSGRLIGVITFDDIVDVLEEEHEEDLLRLAGVNESDLYAAVLTTTRRRFSWLAINLVTAVAASLVIGLFEATIDQLVALAVLMPIVASMGGNAGTQTLTVAVRALATRELGTLNGLRIVGKEALVGLLNGAAFAVLVGLLAWAWFQDARLGAVIAIAMVVNLVVAGAAGAVIPLVLARWKIDPAIASGVFLTTVTDVVGFFAFLGLATLVLF